MTLAAVAAAAFTSMTFDANAAKPFPGTLQTGETAGLATGAPLPEGVYFVNTLSFGVRDTNPDARFLVDVPALVWASPYSIGGGQIQIIGALPMAHLSARGTGFDEYGLYNPFLAGAIAWDLGNGFGFRWLSGFYFNAGDRDLRVPATTWRNDAALSYTADGWNLTANLTYAWTFGTSNYSAFDSTSNGFNLDLTATKTFGKWELGVVGFGSYETGLPNGYNAAGIGRSKQFALGPLVGYNFGPVILQSYLTRDIYAKNQNLLGTKADGKETRFWTRVIIPLWSPEKPMAPLVTKY
ncbi:transporter [Methylopila sp. 73B]|uniref:transporter n=1 Tax=Methylopila sp. 73B TaxID=1120792 RepID=UPI0012DF97BC|nr:transporter [Methylopila sp. 73B]